MTYEDKLRHLEQEFEKDPALISLYRNHLRIFSSLDKEISLDLFIKTFLEVVVR